MFPCKPAIRAQLECAEKALYSISCSARLDAEILLAYCLGKERSYLLTWPERELDEDQRARFHELVRRRLRPEPVAYLVGFREFYSLRLATTPATLVPRPETEMLVERVLQEVASLPSARVLELGTGTGAIALAVAHHCAHCRVTATDIDAETLAVAESNARGLGLAAEFLLSDWFAGVDDSRVFDIVVSNPPYIAEHDPYLSQGDLPAEPRHALCSGPSGLEALSAIVKEASAYLTEGGLLVLEHGWDQGPAVAGLLRENGFHEVLTERDFNRLERMTSGRWRSGALSRPDRGSG